MPSMKSSREMAIAFKKRAISVSSIEVEDEVSGSEFEAAKSKPPTKRQRTTKTSPTKVETPSDKPASVFAKGPRGKAWQSNLGHLIGSAAWWNEVSQRDAVWEQVSRMSKKTRAARLQVMMVTNLETPIEKPKAEHKSTAVSANKSTSKPSNSKATPNHIDLSDNEDEPELSIQAVGNEQKISQELEAIPTTTQLGQ